MESFQCPTTRELQEHLWVSSSSAEGLQQADYDQQYFILATAFGFVVLCCLGSCMIRSHVNFICRTENSVLKSKEQQMTPELGPSYSSLTAEEQEKEQEKVRKSCRRTPRIDGNIVWLILQMPMYVFK